MDRSAGQSPARSTIVPVDGISYPASRGIYVGGSGSLKVLLEGDEVEVTFASVLEGAVYPFRVRRVHADTTATDLVLLY